MFIILWDVKEPAHLSQRAGHVVPGVVVCLLWCIMVERGKCTEILATQSYSKNPRVNKDVCMYSQSIRQGDLGKEWVSRAIAIATKSSPQAI